MNRDRARIERTNAELRARLRDADPFGAEAAGEEGALARVAARLERQAASTESSPPARRFGFAGPAFALAALAAVAWLGLRFAERPRPLAALGSERSTAGAQPASDPRPSSVSTEPEMRQLQFETAGGTRVIWVLDPRFTL